MRKKDIHIGWRYRAKVSETLVTIRIVGRHPKGGWAAINELTGRTIRIKTAGRLRMVVGTTKSRDSAWIGE